MALLIILAPFVTQIILSSMRLKHWIRIPLWGIAILTFAGGFLLFLTIPNLFAYPMGNGTYCYTGSFFLMLGSMFWLLIGTPVIWAIYNFIDRSENKDQLKRLDIKAI